LTVVGSTLSQAFFNTKLIFTQIYKRYQLYNCCMHVACFLHYVKELGLATVFSFKMFTRMFLYFHKHYGETIFDVAICHRTLQVSSSLTWSCEYMLILLASSIHTWGDR